MLGLGGDVAVPSRPYDGVLGGGGKGRAKLCSMEHSLLPLNQRQINAVIIDDFPF